MGSFVHRIMDRLVPPEALKPGGRNSETIRNTPEGIYFSYCSQAFDCCCICLLLPFSIFLIPLLLAVFCVLVILMMELFAYCSTCGYWCKSRENVVESFTCSECCSSDWSGRFSYRNANVIYCYSVIFLLLGIIALPCFYGLLLIMVALVLRIVLYLFSCIL